MAAIIYQNEARDITLIDIPLSISAAQGIDDALLSAAPIAAPFASHDPKSQAAKEKVGQNTIDDELHAVYERKIGIALVGIKAHVSGDWCLPRKVSPKAPPRAKYKAKDKANEEAKEEARDEGKDETPSATTVSESKITEASLGEHLKSLQEETTDDIAAMMASLNVGLGTGNPLATWMVSYEKPHDMIATKSTEEPEIIQQEWDWTFHNPYDKRLDLTVFKPSDGSTPTPQLTFKIPSKSTFFLHDCLDPTSFRSTFRSITDDFRLPRHFNFVLLDPPWPNRSAKRKAAYVPVSTVKELKRMILKMDLDLYIEYDALVGIWITNKPALRDLVLGPDGLFKRLNVGLVEEWIWIKTTSKGEPVSAMNSVWRKPYEVLLLGRAARTSYAVSKPAKEIKRRVIAGVPDLHSRKPCLKELIKPFMPDPEDYSALEIFPRHLVAGWSSWGNEVLKFNWEGYWANSGLLDGGVDAEMGE
jgi:N6-adenosine-specific RNA methylase IME4